MTHATHDPLLLVASGHDFGSRRPHWWVNCKSCEWQSQMWHRQVHAVVEHAFHVLAVKGDGRER